MERKMFVSDVPEPAPIRIRDGGFVVGPLHRIRVEDDEILAAIDGVRVFLPLELEGKLQGMVGQQVLIALMDGRWIAALQKRSLRAKA